jgi:serine/threonine-protein kinase
VSPTLRARAGWLYAGSVTDLGPDYEVSPRIRLVRRLGEGGMGSVWVAWHEGLKSQVAVKFMNPGLAENMAIRERFAREAEAAAAVRSPHVVQILDYGETRDGLPYIAMELLEGEDLSARIGRFGRLPPADVVKIIQQSAKALNRAHERGLVHRDIKPQNIFICDHGDGDIFVKLLDFGIAKMDPNELASGGMTRTGSMLGTPLYMSPEQLLGAKDVDSRSDLWALGIVACEALVGQPPYVADTVGGLTVIVTHGKPAVPSEQNPSLPPSFDAWFHRACARERANRYQTAKELGEGIALAFAQAPAEVPGRIFVNTDASVTHAPKPDTSTWDKPDIRTLGPHSVARAISQDSNSRKKEEDGGGEKREQEQREEEPASRGGSKRLVTIAVAAGAVVVLGGSGFALSSSREPTRTAGGGLVMPVAASAEAPPPIRAAEPAPVASAAAPSAEPSARTPASARPVESVAVRPAAPAPRKSAEVAAVPNPTPKPAPAAKPANKPADDDIR